mmetsp:Transcript_59062/g.117362  ORF Transcript_59062/g.117362 Transcript_59062/m.117362 type:complete len:308 (-) Transcript_59062:164-1087(-)
MAASWTDSSAEDMRSMSEGMPSPRRTAMAAAGIRAIFSIAIAAASCTSSAEEVSSGRMAFTTLSSWSVWRADGTCSTDSEISPHTRIWSSSLGLDTVATRTCIPPHSTSCSPAFSSSCSERSRDEAASSSFASPWPSVRSRWLRMTMPFCSPTVLTRRDLAAAASSIRLLSAPSAFFRISPSSPSGASPTLTICLSSALRSPMMVSCERQTGEVAQTFISTPAIAALTTAFSCSRRSHSFSSAPSGSSASAFSRASARLNSALAAPQITGTPGASSSRTSCARPSSSPTCRRPAIALTSAFSGSSAS